MSQVRCRKMSRAGSLALAMLLQLVPLSGAAACVVGTGSGATCDEAALDNCLPAGAGYDGIVTFDCGGATTITVTSTKIINNVLAIDGGGLVTLSGGHSVGVLEVYSTLRIDNLTIADGQVSTNYQGNGLDNGFGGGILNFANLTIANSTFSGNAASGNGAFSSGAGGAISSFGPLTVINSRFEGNSATSLSAGGFGGAIYCDPTLKVVNSLFAGNVADGAGGAIEIGTGGPAEIVNSTFSDNTARVYGGAVLANHTTTVTGSRFLDNRTIANDGGGGGGGAIFLAGGVDMLTVRDSGFSGNSTGLNGTGGAILSYAPVIVSNSTFSDNSAGSAAGLLNCGGATLTNSTFVGNNALTLSVGGGGGGIGSCQGSTGDITNCTFSGNVSVSNFGNDLKDGMLTLTNNIFASNSPGGSCGGNGLVVTDGGHNIENGGSCGFSGTGCSIAAGTSRCNTDPGLDPAGLRNNDGPTQTVALCLAADVPPGCSATSVAINAGDQDVCSATSGPAPVANLDQRGFVRPGEGASSCAIGAFEPNTLIGVVCQSAAQCQLAPEDTADGDEFGFATALSSGLLVVGAPASANSGFGRVHVFAGAEQGFAEQTQTEPIPVPFEYPGGTVENPRFAESVDVDAATIVVGAPGDIVVQGDKQSIGSAFVYFWNGVQWTQQARLVDESGTCVGLGTDVAISGNTIVLGAPGGDCALVFQRVGSQWLPSASLLPAVAGHRFGQSIDISGDLILVGAPGAEAQGGCGGHGTVYPYHRAGSQWTPEPAVEDPAQPGGSCFGASVAVDGITAIVGAPFDDTGAADAGAAHILAHGDAGWEITTQLLEFPLPAAGDHFGSSVAISANKVVVGAPGVAASQFQQSFPLALHVAEDRREIASKWDAFRLYLPPPDRPASLSKFAFSVAIAPETTAIGAPTETTDDDATTGAVYSVAAKVCGDGVRSTGEDCDDGDARWKQGESCNRQCRILACADPNDTGSVTATDALFILKAAVRVSECDLSVCDANYDGRLTASDALLALKKSVGIGVTLKCPELA